MEEVQSQNRKLPINKIIIQDIQKDGVFEYIPAEAVIIIKKIPVAETSVSPLSQSSTNPPRQPAVATPQEGNFRCKVQIKDYFSPTILQRLNLDRTVFDEYISDFRSQIDVVLIDFNTPISKLNNLLKN